MLTAAIQFWLSSDILTSPKLMNCFKKILKKLAFLWKKKKITKPTMKQPGDLGCQRLCFYLKLESDNSN